MSPAIALKSLPSSPDTAPLEAELKAWWTTESTDWDALVAGVPATLPGGSDLWDGMPEVDSKAVARTTPIFETHLGIPLDIKLIKPGGYKSIDDMIKDLVPQMAELAAKTAAKTPGESV